MHFGEYLVAMLERHGVTHVFGIPGVHNAELYRGLGGSNIRHITPRHEQGAGFMADGYARLSGKPGVCFVISGPGVTNIATAMAQAHQDSIPMLVISSDNRTETLGRQSGHLHELRDQRALAGQVTAFSHRLAAPEELPAVLDRAFAIFERGRPRPVNIEIPIDVMEMPAPEQIMPSGQAEMAPQPADRALDAAATTLADAERPLLLVGGGAVCGADDVRRLAEHLDAPAVLTANARGLMPLGHPLSVPASPSLRSVRRLIEESDVVLAIGTELGPTDYDVYAEGGFSIPGTLIRIEIDADQMARNRAPEFPLLGDAETTVSALLGKLRGAPKNIGGAARARATREAALLALSPAMQQQAKFLDEVRAALPGAVIVGDSTQAVYAGNLYYEADAPRGWFNSATGYDTLGYALPAAIGAKLAAPERPVVCLAGDGGIQFTLAELGSAIDAKAPIIVLVWNNRGYGEIRSYFAERGIARIGVDPSAPDFVAVARAYGLAAERLENRSDLSMLLQEAARQDRPMLIEIDEATIMG